MPKEQLLPVVFGIVIVLFGLILGAGVAYVAARKREEVADLDERDRHRREVAAVHREIHNTNPPF